MLLCWPAVHVPPMQWAGLSCTRARTTARIAKAKMAAEPAEKRQRVPMKLGYWKIRGVSSRGRRHISSSWQLARCLSPFTLSSAGSADSPAARLHRHRVRRRSLRARRWCVGGINYILVVNCMLACPLTLFHFFVRLKYQPWLFHSSRLLD